MSVDVATPPATAPATPAPKKPAKPKPDRDIQKTLTVPARPAAVSAANATTMAATAVAASGPVGWVVAALGVGGVAAAGVARRRARTRRAALWASPRLGPFRALNTGSRGSTSTAGGAAVRTRPSPRPSAIPRAPGSANGARPGGAGNRTGGTSGSRAGTPATPRTGRIPRVGPSSRLPRTQAGHDARRAANRTGNAAKTGGRATQRGLKKAKKWVRRNILGYPTDTPKGGKVRHTSPEAKQEQRNTSAKVRRPANGTTNQPNTKPNTTENKPNAKPGGPARNTERNEPMARPLPMPAATGPIYAAARLVLAAAAEHKPQGILQVRTIAYESPNAIQAFAEAYDILAKASARQAVDSAWSAAMASTANALRAVAQQSRILGPGFDDIHMGKLRRLLLPEEGEGLWDLANNPHR